jgi:hypothetical protein
MAVVYPFQPTPYHKELFDQHATIEQGRDWFIVCGSIASMFDQIEMYARDQEDGTPGWGILLDVDRCPIEALPWLAQFVGVILPAGLTEAQQRDRIRNTDGFKRGSLGAIIAAAQEGLTGDQTVIWRERDASVSPSFGGAYGLTILTYTAETPDGNLVRNKILSQKPGGIILNYATITGGSYLLLRTTYTDYTDVESGFATYNGVRTNQTGV